MRLCAWLSTLACTAKFPAKHETMNKKARYNSRKANGLPEFPSRRIITLLNSLKACLSAEEGRTLSYEDLAQIANRPTNTIADWFVGGATHQLSALLCMLERLSPDVRHRLIDTSCRTHPTLSSPRLAHDFHAVDALRALAEKARGLTLIEGQPAHVRSFVATALGNAAMRTFPESGAVTGLDIHPANEFVPVPGVTYLPAPIASAAPRSMIREAWQLVSERPSQCLIVNGVVGLQPGLTSEIFAHSAHRHVIVADEIKAGENGIWQDAHEPMHRVVVSPTKQHPGWIQLKVQHSD